MDKVLYLVAGFILGFFIHYFLVFKSDQPKGPRQDCTLWVFVREDLKMGKGKIGAQVAHAVLKTIKNSKIPLLANKVKLCSSEYRWDNKIKIFGV